MKRRVLSGSRPTGKLHLGHYWGTLLNWNKLQEKEECFFFVADWHALTTTYDDVSKLKQDTRDMVLDWLAAGLDPRKSVIYRQSDLPEVAELSLYFSFITPFPWLERNPTYKEQLQEMRGKAISTHGFLGYPVLQTADIAIVQGELIPVGEDQLPHLEIAREIIRKFNFLYGEYFLEPQPLLAEAKKIIGTDGRKMSKSYNNAIYLTDKGPVIKKKVRQMITDPQRVRMTDPGRPEVCSVYWLHQLFSQKIIQDIYHKCTKALRGCVDCKDILAKMITLSLADFQKKRRELEKTSGLVEKVLKEGVEKVKPIAAATLKEVRKRLNL